MSNRILYLGRDNVFFSAVNFLLESKNYRLYQFDCWIDCEQQIGDLEVFFIFIDRETFKGDLEGARSAQIPMLCFHKDEGVDHSLGKEVIFIKKPIDMDEFGKNIDMILKR